jgi:4-amino-4-deoxy-L-arabinose transferase-like glycosyltransferase
MRRTFRRRWLTGYLRLRPELTAVLMLLGIWLPGAWQGAFRVDTGLYAAIAKYAYEGGSWWDLHVGAVPYFNKPPLAFWMHGIIQQALGTELWTVRLGSLLAALVAAVAAVRLVRLFAGWRAALLTAIVLATTVEFFRSGHAFSLDLWLAAWFMLALCCAGQAVRRDRGAWMIGVGAALGLSLLTKPLMGFAPLVMIAAWLVWIGRARLLLPLGGAAVLAVVIASPWHAAMVLEHGDAFANKYFGAETISRVVGGGGPSDETMQGPPTGPWWYYLGLMSRKYWPWLLALPFAFAAAIRHGGRGTVAQPMSPDDRRRALERLLLIWTIGWLLALGISSGKSGRYAIIVQPTLAALIGVWLAMRKSSPAHGSGGLARGVQLLLAWLGPAAFATGLVLALLQIRVHRPASEAQVAFESFLDANDDAPIYVHEELLPGSALVYLETGTWPGLARLRADGRGDDPPIGALMLYHRRGAIAPRDVDVVAFDRGDFLVVRIAQPWDVTAAE